MVLWLAVILYGMWQHRTNRYYTISLISKRQLSYLRNNQNARDSLLESGNYFRQFIFIGFLLARAKQQDSAKKAKWMKNIHRSTAESGYRVTTIHFTVYQRHNNIMKIKKSCNSCYCRISLHQFVLCWFCFLLFVKNTKPQWNENTKEFFFINDMMELDIIFDIFSYF